MSELQPIVMVPDLANNQLADPDLLQYYQLLGDRRIWLDGEINENTLLVVRQIQLWNLEDQVLSVKQRKPIYLYFFSPGGDIDVNYSLFDAISLSQTPVYGVNMGRCSSAAAYIFLACHKRYMLPHAYFLFHQGYGSLEGEFSTVIDQIKDYQRQVDELAALIEQRTNYSKDEVEKNISGEWFVRADEAKERGVVDDIITSLV